MNDSNIGERLLEINGVQLCVQAFGQPQWPTILLIHGAGASMLWWDEALCREIAAGGRHVIRFDNRDTGRSTVCPPGQPDYALSDLARDAVGILDALGVARAHIVGQSMAGGIALTLGVDHAPRVASLTFVGTTTGDDDLPDMSPGFSSLSADHVDLQNPAAAVDFILALMRACIGTSRDFDESRMRNLAVQDVARTRNLASALSNHFLMHFDGPVHGGFADVQAPCLVVHGELDPVFPLPHAHALQKALKSAELLVLPGAGHDIPPRVWPLFVEALLRHTAKAPPVVSG